MKLLMLAVLVGFGIATVRNEITHKNDRREIATIIAVYALMGAVVMA